MAGRPVAARGGGLTGAHVGMIVFAFLTVAALVMFILQLTKVQGIEQRAVNAEKRLQRIGQLPGYYENEATNRKTTAARVVEEDLNALSNLIAGEQGLVARTLVERSDEALRSLAGRGGVQEGDTLLTGLAKLGDYAAAARAEADAIKAELAQAQANAEALTRQLKSTRDAFEEQVADLRADFERSVGEFTEKMAAKDEQLAQLQTSLEGREQEIQQGRRSVETERREAQLQMQRRENQIADLQKKIQDLKGSFDPEAVLRKADGRILRAIPGSDIVYINLGANDSVKVGMTFEVYAQTGTVGQSVRGKASLEVLTVMDDTAEARVTRVEPNQPILEGDVVVNLAYEEGRKPKFVVRGEFDLNFDGQPDLNGAEEIRGIIRRWGGQVVNELDESVDYVVVGVPPEATTVGPGASDVVRDQEQRRQLERSAYRKLMDDARALYIPVITQNQFLFLMGYAGDVNLRPR